MSHQHSATTDEGLVRIGNGVGTLGRWFRLFVGLNIALYISLNPILLNPMAEDQLAGYFLQVAGWFALIFVVYHIVFYLFGKFFFVSLSPWAGTAIFLGTPTLLRLMGWVPMEFQVAFGFYVGISLVATFFIRYGGCEVVAIPGILFRQRYTMYCPYNAIDAIERAVALDKFTPGHKALAITAMAIAIFVGGYKIVFDMLGFFGRWGLAFSLDSSIAWALLLPIGYLAYLTFSSLRKTGSWLSPEVRKFGLGGIILAALTVTWLYPPAAGFPLWQTVLAAGTAYVILELALIAIGKRKLEKA